MKRSRQPTKNERKKSPARSRPVARKSDRKQQRPALYFDKAFEALNEGFYEWNIADGSTYYSDRVLQAIGLSRRDLKTAADWHARIHPEDRATYDAALVAHFKRKSGRFECDFRFRSSDGSWRWARQHGIALRDKRGRALRMIGSTGDITEWKRMEDALRASEQRHTLAMRAATEGMYDWSIATGSLYLSDRAKEFFAFAEGPLTPQSWNERVHPDDFPAYRQAVVRYLRGSTDRLEIEYRIRNASGGWRWILDHGIAVRDAKGRATRLVGAIRDVDDRKQAEFDLRRARDEATAALERQTATAEILRVISQSPTDVRPVFDIIAERSVTLCQGQIALVSRLEGGMLHLASIRGMTQEGVEALSGVYPMPLDAETLTARAYRNRSILHLEDVLDDPRYQQKHTAVVAGWRAGLSVPLMRGDEVIGVIFVGRPVPGRFTESQIDLLKTFADQAVIAVENVRLFNETKEALERQTATAEILKVISRSPTDTQPVFETISQSAARLCEADYSFVFRFDGQRIHLAAHVGTAESFEAMREAWPRAPSRGTAAGRAVLERGVVHVPDVQADPDYELGTVATAAAYRSTVAVPMLRDGVPIGSINVSRSQPSPFTDRQIALLRTFADQAVIAVENVRLFNETKDALARQTATADVLASISGSMTNTQPVFDRIVQNIRRLFGTRFSVLQLLHGDMVDMAAVDGDPGFEKLRSYYPRKLDETTGGGRAMLSKEVVQIAPVLDNPDTPEATQQFAREFGFNSTIFAPMVHEGKVIGVIGAAHPGVRVFDDREIALLETFAKQAVIAIENVRLFNETREALERQTATAEILKVIASSPADVQPVFDAIARSATRLVGGFSTVVAQLQGDQLQLAALTSTDKAGDDAVRSSFPLPLGKALHLATAIQEGQPRWIVDVEVEADTPVKSTARARGWRSAIAAPMLRGAAAVGVINVTRASPGAFSDHEVELLKTFADQAVIAIENVRLFNETKEALERQTAISEILRVISSSPGDVQPVLQAVAERASRIIGAQFVDIILAEGTAMRVGAAVGDLGRPIGEAIPLDRSTVMGRSIVDRKPVHIADLQAEAREFPLGQQLAMKYGHRTILAVPLVREDRALGTILVRRTEVRPIEEKHVALLQTFADQAAIAIENARLFNETKEALERQTATAEILKVISSSPTDVEPVFVAIIRKAVQLSGSNRGALYSFDGEKLHLAAHHNQSVGALEALNRVYPMTPDRSQISGRSILGRAIVEIPDVRSDPEYLPGLADQADLGSLLAVPMLRADGKPSGVIVIQRSEAGAFEPRHVDLLKTFADQAVIAVENVRLFNETKEALERQTSTSDILKVIAASPSDVSPVFETILEHAARLCDSPTAAIFRYDGTLVHLVATRNWPADALEKVTRQFPMPPPPGMAVGRAILEKSIVRISDALADTTYDQSAAAAGRWRRVLAIPLLREGEPVGAFTVTWPDPSETPKHHVELLQTFADQAVIAIENVRLFNELQQRTQALSTSVQQLTALGEVGQAISSTLELETVLKTIVTHALRLTGLDGGSIYEYDEVNEEFRLQAAENMDTGVLATIRRVPIRKGDGTVGGTAVTLEPMQAPDILDKSYKSSRKELLVGAGYRAVLTVPLLREGRILGALSVTRKAPGAFAPEIVELLKTFATQSAMAIQNARLFREIEEKGRQLEEASKHKSQFLASMSHELRTPLNAILGFNEMILGDVYGEVPADMKEPLTDIQTSGKHLLRLINNVLDLAKIEAGRMELALGDYSVHDTVESVRSTLRPLAEAKGLDLVVDVPPDLPLAHGDSGRITQCLMNLAGNSLKFTKQGSVGITVELQNGTLTWKVQDTGIGIPADKIGSLFTEFKQTDATIASEYGGTGLGLSITKKFIEMHGGRIWAESELGQGSKFIFEVPLRAAEKAAE